MQSVLQFFVQFVMALFGAIGTAIASIGLTGLLFGGSVAGGGWGWRKWRRRRALRRAELEEERRREG